MNVRSWLVSLARWARRHVPEMAIFGLGVSLRLTMSRYDVTLAYDAAEHWDVVRWIVEHKSVPPVQATFEAFHPPLFYLAAAALVKLGVTRQNVVWLPVCCGIVRLAILWAGIEVALPRSRTARLGALALAAVTASSIHIDGMLYGEPLSAMLVSGAMLLSFLAFRRRRTARWRVTPAAGVLLGLALLAKISAVVVLASICAAALLELFLSGRPWHERVPDFFAWTAMVAVCLVVCGWYFARNVRDYGRPFVTSFDLPSQHWLVARQHELPYLDIRTLGYVLGWNPFIFHFPYYPTAILHHPQFFPVAVASTFVDFWNFSFSGIDPSEHTGMIAGARPMTSALLHASQYATVGGTVIFIVTAIAWLRCCPRAFRRQDWATLALLLVPASMLLSALHFAIWYPIDNYGVVKGAYMQFAAPPLCGLFGGALAWSRSKPVGWPIFAVLLAALWTVAGYSLYCRFRLPIVPLGS